MKRRHGRQDHLELARPLGRPKSYLPWTFDDAIVTPHMAVRSDGDWNPMVGVSTEKIHRLTGRKPLTSISMELG